MKKRILYLCHRIPYPPNKGDKIRSFNEIKHLSKSYIIDLIALADNPGDLKYEQKLKKYCRQVKVFSLDTRTAKIKGLISLLLGKSISQGYFYTKNFQTIYNLWISKRIYHAVICFSSSMAEYVFRSKKNWVQGADNFIMDFCDLDSDKWKQYARKTSFLFRLLYKIEAKRLLNFETKINKSFDQSVFISTKEAALFRDNYPEAGNITIIPNGVDHCYFDPEKTELSQNFPSPMIAFYGAMDYYANIDGVIWFTQEILPRIKKDVANIKFYIVGSNPDPTVKALEKDPAIHVTGFVDDIREYYKAADICVIPLRIARGIQNKVLEALSMEKPIVTTSAALQGIHPEVHNVLKIEDNPAAFADQIVNLLKHKAKGEKQGRSARQFIFGYYDWTKNLRGMSALM